MSILKRASILLCAVIVGNVATFSGGAVAGQTKYESFRADGIISTDDIYPATPLKEGFRLAAPVDTYGDTNVTAAENGDGSLDVKVQATTKYYKWTGVNYARSDYAGTIAAGNEARVNGKYGKAGATYEVLATVIYIPPSEFAPSPPNPICQTAKDYTLARHFTLTGKVSQTGANLTNLGLYSDFFGFVVKNVSNPNSPHVAAIVAHDRGSAGINVVATGEQNNMIEHTRVPYTTRYRKQNPTSLVWEEKTKDEVVTLGATTFDAGRYTCSGDGDWRLFAQFVFAPVPGAATGNLQFSEVMRQTSAGTSNVPNTRDDTTYAGNTVTGDESVDPGAPFSLNNVDWYYDTVGAVWNFDGEWTYTNPSGFGTMFGTLGGTWSPASHAISATAILSDGTGRYVGKAGAGTVTGTGLTALGGSIPATFDANWVVSVM